MKRPKMVMFDYGHTLCLENGYDNLRAMEKLVEMASANPDNVTAQQLHAAYGRYHDRLPAGIIDWIHFSDILRLISADLKVEFECDFVEVERIYWDAVLDMQPMPGAAEMLAWLRGHKIRTAVLSNMSYGSDAMTRRLNRAYPEHGFDFVMVSSEYASSKPDPQLFRAALNRAGLKADEVWYCGDNAVNDVLGAFGAGMHPVWFRTPIKCDYADAKSLTPPDCPYTEISDWRGLTELLENCAQ